MSSEHGERNEDIKNVDFTVFSFCNSANFLSISLENIVLPLARAYDSISPLVEKSIPIKYKEGEDISVPGTALLVNLLQSGTKPFDAIMYFAVLRDKRMDEFGKYFLPIKATGQTVNKLNEQIKILTACVIVIYTRGTFPAFNGSSVLNPLPKFILQMLPELKLTTELKLKQVAISFDPKHLDMKSILLGDYYGAWDTILANRLNLGIAGHKPLKLIEDCKAKLKTESKTTVPLITNLINAQVHAKGGFYIGLHPIGGTIAATRPKFFLNCLHCVFMHMNGTNSEKYNFLLSLPYLKNETLLKNSSLHLFAATWENWSFDTWEKDLGKCVKFISEGREYIKGKELVDMSEPMQGRDSKEEEGLDESEFDEQSSSGSSRSGIKVDESRDRQAKK